MSIGSLTQSVASLERRARERGQSSSVSPRQVLKAGVNGIFLLAALIPGLLCGFGRFEAVFAFFAQCYSLVPGLPGDYLRIAFYKLTLAECHLSSRISFGSYFAHPQARVGSKVYIGSNCILGMVDIGSRTQIASGVQVLSGRHQHARGENGEISGSEQGAFSTVTIGADCWIGAACIVMADIHESSTVGAGSVVTRPIPAHSLAIGSPARVIRTTIAAPAEARRTEWSPESLRGCA